MSLKSFYDHEYFLCATFYDCDMRLPQNFLRSSIKMKKLFSLKVKNGRFQNNWTYEVKYDQIRYYLTIEYLGRRFSLN